jgi:polyhydroxyalkanoate synthase
MDDPDALATFLKMEQWIFDSPDLAGRALHEFAQSCYRENALAMGSLRIGERIVDLTKITMPVLNIYARDDHLVPPAASRALGALVATDDYHAVEVPGGHIGIYVGGSARQKVAETVSTWLAARI